MLHLSRTPGVITVYGWPIHTILTLFCLLIPIETVAVNNRDWIFFGVVFYFIGGASKYMVIYLWKLVWTI